MTHNDVNIFALTKQDTSVMKGIAIIAMLCHHVYTCQPEWVEAYPYVLTMIGVLGKVCVAMFLFCSGYGLSIQYEKVLQDTNSFIDNIRTTILFLLKRFIKFYSAYWFIFLIFVPITIYLFNRPLAVAYGEDVNILKGVFLDILGIHGFKSYNITWWFNKLIVLLYLAFPILYLFIRKTKWIGLILCFITMRFATRLGIFNYYELMVWQFPLVLGIGWAVYQNTLANLTKYVKYHTLWINIGVVLLMILGVLQRLYNIMPLGNIWGSRFDGFLCILILLVIILLIRQCKHIYLLLTILGKHSINIYLIHTFFNYYWEPIHRFLHTNAICRFMGLNMWFLLISCLLISLLIEYLKDILYWNKLTDKILLKIK